MGKVREFSRYNSGKNLLDSGDYYGRKYEQPPLPEDHPMVQLGLSENHDGTYEPEIVLYTVPMLEDQTEELQFMQELFDSWADKYEEDGWPELIERFMEGLGYSRVCDRNNTYNHESHLDQDYVYELWVPEHQDVCDWIYCKDAVLIIQLHTGCDIRGGYSPPIFLRSIHDEYALPTDFTAQLEVWDGTDWDELGHYDRRKISRIFGWTKTPDSQCCLLDDQPVRLQARPRW